MLVIIHRSPPTQKPFQKGTSGNEEWRLYSFVAKHFMATLSQDAKFEKKHAKFRAGKQEFELTGVKVTQRGFTDILTGLRIPENQIPDFKKGNSYDIQHVGITKGEVHLFLATLKH